jgi:hypothetical protein
MKGPLIGGVGKEKTDLGHCKFYGISLAGKQTALLGRRTLATVLEFPTEHREVGRSAGRRLSACGPVSAEGQ